MMSKWRLVILGLLFATPVLFMMALGILWLWEHPDIRFYIWWPLAACLALAYLLAWYWQRKARLLPSPEVTPPLQWTDRDREAWKLVEARGQNARTLSTDQLMEVQCYVDTAQEMAIELARFYHPKAKDPVGSLTLVEVLAVIELAASDMAELVDKYLPGGHLLTVNQWRHAAKVGDYYNWASLAYWAVSALYNPVETLARYAASQVGLSQPFRALQENLVLWFYTAYVHRVGTYLIDVNSGRLRVGARRYRSLLEQAGLREMAAAPVAAPADGATAQEPVTPPAVTITIMGQVKAGKSSLVNALLGERRAGTDVLPLTAEITRYQLQPPGIPNRLVLLDTVGYAHEGPKADQLAATRKAAQESDLLLLVLNARDPARQPDRELLQGLKSWFSTNPHLRLPPILAVATHVDLLSPTLEWSPPYDWRNPRRPKEQNIHDAVQVVQQQLGDHVIGVLPVCTAEGRIYGVQEGLLPEMVTLLGEARAVALLRCLHAEANAGKIRKVLSQLLQAGKVAFQAATRS